jgi:AraC-like DNA-binding protein
LRVELEPGYRELSPPRALAGVVACLWMRVCAEAGEVRIVPDASADVIWQRGEGTTIAGPDTGAKLVRCAPGDVMVGMRFVPGAAGGMLGVPLDQLRDQRVEVGEVDGAFEVEAERTPAEVVTRLLSVAADRRPDPLVVAAGRRLGERSVAELAGEVGLSERQLRRRFHTAAGYGPKTFERVLRFRRFVARIDAGHADLARLALDTGYADQAHLTRESVRLMGIPPAAFLAEATHQCAPGHDHRASFMPLLRSRAA